MIVALASAKGGVAKTTTAIHLAASLSADSATLLVDWDKETKSATKWKARIESGKDPLPFAVCSPEQMPKLLKDYEHVVIDTKAAASKAQLQDLIEGSSLLIVPTFANIMSLDTLLETIDSLRGLDSSRFRVLLTNVPPKPQKDGDAARALIEELGLPIFRTQIRHSKAFERAAERGLTVGQVRGYEVSSLAANDYETLCEEIGEIVAANEVAPAVAAGR